MKKIFACLFILIASIAFLSACATLPDSGVVRVKGQNAGVTIAFSDEDRRIIYDYYRSQLPPGLAKKKALPPGLQKHLEKNGKLPPGLEKRLLPPELEIRLSFLPAGYVRMRAGNDIVLINEITHLIMDVIYNVGY